jgi:serine/tyrosine/threonine adenylyltransferase
MPAMSTVNPPIPSSAHAAAGVDGLFAFDNSYARELEGLYVAVQPSPAPAPRMIKFNRALAVELGLDADALDSPAGAAIFAGNTVPAGASPIAQAYAGHQFGGFSPQLGDGRALLLGEVLDRGGRRRDIAFKGSGRTPFSRGGDGKSALGPVLREYIMGEAMHAYGIPTTRALAAVATGERVLREGPLPGGVLTRVANSHLRVGTFEFFAARRDQAQLTRLAEYAIARHYPELAGRGDRYLALLHAVAERQAALIAQWMGIGFIHGVMNTDNMSISGETIDYGPCAFMDAYDPATVFSSIDTQGRYAYGNQPWIARWNLARFAETLLSLIDSDPKRAVALATEVIDVFPARYQAHFARVLSAKLGLSDMAQRESDGVLSKDFLDMLERHSVDFTQAFRLLADAAEQSDERFLALFADAADAQAWLPRWRTRLNDGTLAPAARAQAMRQVNPVYIPRNHQVEAALTAAVESDDLAPFDRLLAVLAQPFEERAADAEYALPAPVDYTASYCTFCGT